MKKNEWLEGSFAYQMQELNNAVVEFIEVFFETTGLMKILRWINDHIE